MGRESKLDDLVEKRIVAALKDGHSYARAAKQGGISEHTLYEWIRRGEGRDERDDPEGRFAIFATKVRAADHAAEDAAVKVLTSKFHSEDDRVSLAAAQWWLERRRPADWAKKQEVEEPLSPEEAERLVAEAAQLSAAGGKP